MEIVPVAGPDNGAYLRTYGHTGADGDCSLKGAFIVSRNQPYLFSVWHKDHEGGWQKASLSSDGTTESSEVQGRHGLRNPRGYRSGQHYYCDGFRLGQGLDHVLLQ